MQGVKPEMPIKNLRFSFDVPIADLLALVATRNDSLHIDVIGDGKEAKVPKQLRNAQAGIAGLLEAPKSGKGGNTKIKARDEHGPITTYHAVGLFLLVAPDHSGTMTTIKETLMPLGVNPVSISPQMGKMRTDGNARLKDGVYTLTAAGVKAFQKIKQEREEAAKGAHQ